MHGAENLTGLVLSNQSLIEWRELIDLFRPINIVTCNKLFITMATCYGRHLYKGVDPYQKSPYSGCISASKEISWPEIIEKFTLLFERLIDNGNLVQAYLDMQKTASNFYYKDAERTFEESYKAVYKELTENADYKAKFIEESRKQAEQMGHPIADEKMSEFIFQKALKDIYIKQKEAFEFEHCE